VFYDLRIVINTRLETWTAHGDAISVAQWETSMAALRSQVNYAREH